jgi:ABC-2 type transport system permease protein
MAADTTMLTRPTAGLPVARAVLQGQRRTLLLWGIAVAAVCSLYTSFYPSMGGGAEMEALIDSMPAGLVEALGYDQIGTAAGYLQSTVYGLLGPILLLVFAIGTGARLVAGQEEDGTLELELTAPVTRRQVFTERLGALWLDLVLLVGVVTVATVLLVVALDMDASLTNVLAGSVGLLLLVVAFGTIAFAVGTATGRRGVALGTAAGLAVVAYMLDAIGPTVDLAWMTAVSPFAWYVGGDPLIEGFDGAGLARLAVLTLVAVVAGWTAFRRRDLMV